MKTEKQKMLSGQLYDASDLELVEERKRCRKLLEILNSNLDDQDSNVKEILQQLLPNTGKDLILQPPFFCDYGSNIQIGDQVFMNFNCIILDVMKVTIGSRSMLGPNVQIYTATHPLNHKERASGLEYAKPIFIGKDVWIGGGAIINPGVSIGDRTVIGAGSVVTKDLPSDVFAAGNPCRIIKTLEL
jgi:maltose O-acetyltransferase